MTKTGLIIEEQVRLLKANYLDQYQHIVQKDGDGGDSLNRLGCADACIYFLRQHNKYFNGSFLLNALPFNQPSPGRFCRNPTPGRWYSNPNNVTRDQMLPVESAMAIGKLTNLARVHAKLRLKRCLFHFSHENDGADSGLPLVTKMPDAPSPSELGLLIRACDLGWLSPLLWILDLFLLFDVLIVRWITDRNRYDMDANLLPVVLASVSARPTFISLTAAMLYSRTNAGSRIVAYYSEANGRNGIEPLGKIMNETFKVMGEIYYGVRECPDKRENNKSFTRGL